jgi:anti-sigma factor ChrR (cupin superfamily)
MNIRRFDRWIPLLALVAAAAAAPHGLDPAPAYERVELKQLWNIAEWQDRLPWKPFRPGVEIHRLYGDGITGPNAALLRFRETAKVPLHRHTGYEHILVLHGTQRDQNSTLETGTLMVNPPGTAHSVIGEAGCIVLAIYERPVAFHPSPIPAADVE